MADLKSIAGKVKRVIGEEGITQVPARAVQYMRRREEKKRWEREILNSYSDVLFISGCNEQLPHPHRYRVVHQMEQLAAQGFSSETVYYTDIQLDMVRCYAVFIIFRCPATSELEQFVQEAHRLHKKVFYDVDDLVIDTCYTDQIPFLDSMSDTDRAAYDANVRNMGKMLSMCDGAITTTAALAAELQKYVPKVLINRNTASDEMLGISEAAWRKQQEIISNQLAASTENSVGEKIVLGYFSGSATHLDDLMLILPALCKILKKHPEVRLRITGILDIPEELRPYASQIETEGFLDYRSLPERIAAIDINLAPLCDTIFNAAKSENKWVEAALVRVPTLASRLGAFCEMITEGVDGVLADPDEWEEKLEQLIKDQVFRKRLGEQAYRTCRQRCVTIAGSRTLADFVTENRGTSVAFVLPGLSISGGIRVALMHARFLYEAGCSISVLLLEGQERWLEVDGIGRVPVLPADPDKIRGYFDHQTATMWNTLEFIRRNPSVGQKHYLVQNYEPDFYEPSSIYRSLACATYRAGEQIRYQTMSTWCQEWLKESYGTEAIYIPNGIERNRFRTRERKLEGKIRILIEGDCNAAHKNVDESFRIMERLPREQFEIWYMSYSGEPKDWYRVDRFLHRVPYEKVSEVYEQCDILLKTSTLESFSYPPLEMMATGGYAVVLTNDGNREYLKDRKNCLLYEQAGDIDTAVQLIRDLIQDQELQKELVQGALETADSRDWEQIRPIVLRAYGLEALS